MEITTERLLIRRFQAEDWKDLYAYLSDEEVVRYEPYQAYTEEQSRTEAVIRAGDNSFLAVCLRETGKLIGNLYFAKGDFDTWELGYVFHRAFHGRGYAKEAACAVITHGIKTRGVRRITAMCNPDNIPSWKLMERIGMRREGHLLQNIYFQTDENDAPLWQDTYEYAILADEWLERK